MNNVNPILKQMSQFGKEFDFTTLKVEMSYIINNISDNLIG